MPTPLTFDLFSRILAAGFDEHTRVFTPTAGQRFFGRPETGSFTVFSPNANALDIEIIRANLKLAPLMPRGGVGRFLGGAAAGQHVDLQFNQGTTFSRKYPFIEEESNLGADQLLYRLIAYEGPYENLTIADRTRILGRRAYLELVRRCIRTFEYLAWQSLTLGMQSANAIGVPVAGQDYDWRRSGANTIVPTHGWGNAAGTPLADLDGACDQANFAGKVLPNFAVFGGTCMQYFQTNPTVTTAYANKLYFELLRFELDAKPSAEFQPFVDAGLIPYGRIKTPRGYELTIFTYPHMYDAGLAAAQTATKFFPDNLVLLGSTNARADRYYGPPERLEMTQIEMANIMERFGFNPATPIIPPNVWGANTVLPQMFYTDAYSSNDRKHVTLRVQAAPVFPTTQTDAWVTIQAGSTT